MVIWATADRPNLQLYAAKDPSVVRWRQEDRVINVVRSDPLNVNDVSEISLTAQGELEDVFDGNERDVAVVIQRPYMRQAYVPTNCGFDDFPHYYLHGYEFTLFHAGGTAKREQKFAMRSPIHTDKPWQPYVARREDEVAPAFHHEPACSPGLFKGPLAV